MNFIKKTFVSIFIILIALSFAIALTMYSVNKGHLNAPLKKIIEFYLSKNDIKAVLYNLEFKENRLSIEYISLSLIDNARGEIKDFNLFLNFKNFFSNSLIEANFNIDKISLISNNNEEIINTSTTGHYSLNIIKKDSLTDIRLTSIKSDILTDEQGANLPLGNALCSYKISHSKGHPKTVNCKLTFGDKAYLLLNGIITDKSIDTSAAAANMPLIIYQTVEKIIPDNPIVAYLREHIKQGFIQNGELNIKLDKKLFKKNILVEDNLKANLHISNFEYKYHKDLPPLTKIDTNIIISGREIKFLINEAYSGKSLISDGIMTFKWEGPDKSQFIFNATAKGEINDLIAFVPSDTYKKIKAQNIDLSKIKGTANSIIELIIPISPDVPNRYNVLSTLTNISFNTLDNKVLLQNGEAKGSLKDNKLNISGKGNINNYESSFIYDHDISDKHNECLLKIKSNITANNQRFGVLKLISGTTILNFEYKKQHNNESFITVHSNLDNLEFYIDKVSIHKKLYKRANLYLYTKLNDTDRNIEFNLSGHDNLKIHGNVLIKENIYNINLASVKHNYTDLKGKIIIDNHNLNTELYGSGLDLSNANMMQFLEKEGDSTHNINLKTNISKIILKNNIILTNLDLVIKCDKVRCFYGFLNANIENKKVKMSLTAKDTFEQWLIESDNAGALLNGLGMYTTMQNGQIHIKLNTKRYEVKKGEIVPILDGKFSIKHFKVVDTPFLTRLVSFVSLPGFLSSITNNKNILFDDMTGKFNYRGNIITIFDTEAHGPFFDFTMKGNIDTKQQFITVTGNVIPSFFLISTIVTKIPVVGKIFSKVALYSLKMHYK
ncbi:YhdP family protein [Rickettsia prowazekii]|uniref:DUF3971 domain-containing protein n=2 Tax=Rickettsia prowazekii TaxID=782 RepID=Q9ZCG8_RICPR|nr:DUF3971 domain-containing protein [Rickettsia prowazekii]ADE30345.1 hypothetical protein rpr22_CDS762 [Rickettsia prowazekii str. Rp22]AFE49576.1 hypothetical protein M9W_03780 [Rickettsia prowazekii str. Chernikova]AFE50420.1 hypothetical protein M9Y_03785 [Rickettsia prowazekii str. Katsinyian]AFE51264.1 hypothetical protein MA1_03775 [Rickettsia prowazekii str. BuV67-CWPP]AFE52102.1 hypothetical protein MA3_03820 [Rickettsia prowazekii str. Dachau]